MVVCVVVVIVFHLDGISLLPKMGNSEDRTTWHPIIVIAFETMAMKTDLDSNLGTRNSEAYRSRCRFANLVTC